MKTLVFFAVLLCVTFADVYTPENKELLTTSIKECLDETKVERGLVEKLMKKQVVDDDKLKDFTHCLYRKLDFMSEDGTINDAVIKKFHEGLAAPVRKAMAACVDKRGATNVETSFLIVKCTSENIPNDIDVAVEL